MAEQNIQKQLGILGALMLTQERSVIKSKYLSSSTK